jgi:hypothetical protein
MRRQAELASADGHSCTRDQDEVKLPCRALALSVNGRNYNIKTKPSA